MVRASDFDSENWRFEPRYDRIFQFVSRKEGWRPESWFWRENDKPQKFVLLSLNKLNWILEEIHFEKKRKMDTVGRYEAPSATLHCSPKSLTAKKKELGKT